MRSNRRRRRHHLPRSPIEDVVYLLLILLEDIMIRVQCQPKVLLHPKENPLKFLAKGAEGKH